MRITYYTGFSGLKINEVRHYRTRQIVRVGDIQQGKIHFGVVHLRNVKWFIDGSVSSAEVDLYIAFVEDTKEMKIKEPYTDQKVMAIEMSMWEPFRGLMCRARDEDGKIREHFDVTQEHELWFAFTRKNDLWYPTSGTFNSWIEHEQDVPQVVRDAGIKGSCNSKEKLINLMPRHLWRQILVKLTKLTPYDGEPWTIAWARYIADDEHAMVEEINRMRWLIFVEGEGSKLFRLILQYKRIGDCGNRAVKAFCTVLQEEVRDRVDGHVKRCSYIKHLDLARNGLKDEHLWILSGSLRSCRKLEILGLDGNKIGDDGCLALSKAFPRLENLKKLYLNYNQIGDKGCIYLRNSLPRNVDELWLENNEFSAAAFRALKNWGSMSGCDIYTDYNDAEEKTMEVEIELSEGDAVSDSLSSIIVVPNELTDQKGAKPPEQCSRCTIH